jgi:hypothetical protein
MRLLTNAFAAAVIISASVLAPGVSSAATSDPFAGAWESNDSGDGSYQTLDVYGSGTGGKHGTRLNDTVASRACDSQPANVQGPGFVSGDEMVVFFTVTCPGSGKGPTTGLVGPAVFTYDPDSDTMTDDSGTVWHRLN